MSAAEIEVKIGKKLTIKVVTSSNQRSAISDRDAIMDARAVQAVKSAVEKAKFCQKPVARYDVITKKAYIEYPDGEKVYVQ